MTGPAEDLKAYMQALMHGHHATGLGIERKYGLEGYPPEVVSHALNMAQQGQDPEKAAAIYCGADPEDLEDPEPETEQDRIDAAGDDLFHSMREDGEL